MQLADLIERAKRQLSAGAESPRIWQMSEIDIAATVPQATHELARAVMYDTRYRTLLQQDYTVTLDATGTGQPLLATGSITGLAGEILMEGIKHGVVLDNDGNRLLPLPHYADFLRPQSVNFAYYCLKDRNILTRALGAVVTIPADIQSVNGPLTITSSFEPLNVPDFPTELEDELVHTLCAIVLTKMAPQDGAQPITAH